MSLEVLRLISFFFSAKVGFMNKLILVITLILLSVSQFVAQPPAVKASTAPKFGEQIALAKLALEAHGGEKLRSMRTLITSGSVDVTTSAINQAIPATFHVVLAREK